MDGDDAINEERLVIIAIIYTGIGLLLSLMIPSFAIKSQKTDNSISCSTHMVCVSLFLLFSMLSWIKWRESPEYFLALFCLLILLLISITDHWFGLIPNRFTYPSIVVLLIARWFIHTASPFGYYVAMCVGGLSLFLLAYLTRGMGIGDAKLFALAGLIVGWPDIWLAFWLATISGTGYILFRFVIKKPIGRKTPFPFGPHLALGVYLTYLYGDEIQLIFVRSWFYPF